MIASRVLVLMTACVLALGLAGCSSDDDAPTSTPSSPTTPAEPVDYVNLGDSYSAGTGVLPSAPGSPFACQRAAQNYAQILAAKHHFTLTDVSCAGADTDDLATPQHDDVPAQLDALDDQTDLVTLMLGGNDQDLYSGAIRRCRAVAASDVTGAPCRERYGNSFVDSIDATIYPNLVEALEQIRAKARNARVFIVGYPWLLPAQTGCYPDMPVAAGDVSYLRGVQAALNDAVRRAAAKTGVTFVDMARASEGRDACAPADRRWIEPMTTRTFGAAIHPNARGQQAIAAQVSAAL